MGLVNIDTKGMIDEAAKVLPPVLQPLLKTTVDQLVAGSRAALTDFVEQIKGLTVSVTIVDNAVVIKVGDADAGADEKGGSYVHSQGTGGSGGAGNGELPARLGEHQEGDGVVEARSGMLGARPPEV